MYIYLKCCTVIGNTNATTNSDLHHCPARNSLHYPRSAVVSNFSSHHRVPPAERWEIRKKFVAASAKMREFVILNVLASPTTNNSVRENVFLPKMCVWTLVIFDKKTPCFEETAVTATETGDKSVSQFTVLFYKLTFVAIFVCNNLNLYLMTV